MVKNKIAPFQQFFLNGKIKNVYFNFDFSFLHFASKEINPGARDENQTDERYTHPAVHTIASKAKKSAFPADITSSLAPDLLLRSREPEHHNFKHS